MARTNTDDIASPYYPPRARWYSRLCYPYFAIQRVLHLEKIHLPSGLSPAQFLLSLVVPGFSFCVLGRRIEGLLFLAGYGLAAFVFLAWLGYTAGSVAYGLMVAAHAISLIYLQLRWRPSAEAPLKAAIFAGTLLGLGLLVYWPLLGWIERHWIMPVRVDQRVVLVLRSAKPESLQRGDWAVCRVAGLYQAGLAVQSGFVLGPVLAVGGDHVKFGTNLLTVNGVAQPWRTNMPVRGELLIPENRWFVWPGFAITGRGNEAAIADAMVRIGTVSNEEFIGRPLKRWFWRRQAFETL